MRVRTKIIIGFFVGIAIIGSCTGSNKNDKNAPTTTTTADQVETTVTNPTTTTTTIEPVTTTTTIVVILTDPTTLSSALSEASTKVLGRRVVDSTTVNLFIKAYNQKESSFQLGTTNYLPPVIDSYAEAFLRERFPQEAERNQAIKTGNDFMNSLEGPFPSSGGYTCADGTHSDAQHSQGACSQHGGIR